MIILSYNITGLGGNPKIRAIHHLIKSTKPDTIMFQETMSSRLTVIDFLSKILLGYLLCGVHVVGQLGGLITAWNLKFDVSNKVFFLSRILLEGTLKVLNLTIKLFNCYGSYTDRKAFWEVVVEKGFLMDVGIIIGGDLNLVMSKRDI